MSRDDVITFFYDYMKNIGNAIQNIRFTRHQSNWISKTASKLITKIF